MAVKDFRYQLQRQSVAYDPKEVHDEKPDIYREMEKRAAKMRRNAAFKTEHDTKLFRALSLKYAKEAEDKTKRFNEVQQLKQNVFDQEMVNYKKKFENEYGAQLQDSKKTKQLLDFGVTVVKTANAVNTMREQKAEEYARKNGRQFIDANTLGQARKLAQLEGISIESAIRKTMIRSAEAGHASEEQLSKLRGMTGYRARHATNYAIQRNAESWPEWFHGDAATNEDGSIRAFDTSKSHVGQEGGYFQITANTKIYGQEFLSAAGAAQTPNEIIANPTSSDQLQLLYDLLETNYYEGFAAEGYDTFNVAEQAKNKIENKLKLYVFGKGGTQLSNNIARDEATARTNELISFVKGPQELIAPSMSTWFNNISSDKGQAKALFLGEVQRGINRGEIKEPDLEKLKSVILKDANGNDIVLATDWAEEFAEMETEINRRSRQELKLQDQTEANLALQGLKKYNQLIYRYGKNNVGPAEIQPVIDWLTEQGLDLDKIPEKILKHGNTGTDKDPSSVAQALRRKALEPGGLREEDVLNNAYLSNAAQKEILKLTNKAQPDFKREGPEIDRILESGIATALREGTGKFMGRNEFNHDLDVINRKLRKKALLRAQRDLQLYDGSLAKAYEASATQVLEEWKKTRTTTAGIGEGGDVPTLSPEFADPDLTAEPNQSPSTNLYKKIRTTLPDKRAALLTDIRGTLEGVGFTKEAIENWTSWGGSGSQTDVENTNIVKALTDQFVAHTSFQGDSFKALNKIRESFDLEPLSLNAENLSFYGLSTTNAPPNLSDEWNARREKINSQDISIEEKRDQLSALSIEAAVLNQMATKYNVSPDSDVLTELVERTGGYGRSQFKKINQGVPLKETSLAKTEELLQGNRITSLTAFGLTANDLKNYREDHEIDASTFIMNKENLLKIARHTLLEDAETVVESRDLGTVKRMFAKRPAIRRAFYGPDGYAASGERVEAFKVLENYGFDFSLFTPQSLNEVTLSIVKQSAVIGDDEQTLKQRNLFGGS